MFLDTRKGTFAKNRVVFILKHLQIEQATVNVVIEGNEEVLFESTGKKYVDDPPVFYDG